MSCVSFKNNVIHKLFAIESIYIYIYIYIYIKWLPLAESKALQMN